MVIALLIAASLPKPRSVITEGADLTAQPPRSQALGFLGAQWKRHLKWAMCLSWGTDL